MLLRWLLLAAFRQERFLCVHKLIFWDFDGVIKDSVCVKTDAFEQMFQPYGVEIVERVRTHHLANGGVSRFEKFPLYLEWVGEKVTQEKVADCCLRFSALVLRGVIDAPWVQGVEDILRSNPRRQEFVLVTATPQTEIEEILVAINLRICFSKVFGAPVSKNDAIRKCLEKREFDALQCLMIGDSKADWDAALANNVPFLLRRHDSNRSVFENYTGDSVANFTELKL